MKTKLSHCTRFQNVSKTDFFAFRTEHMLIDIRKKERERNRQKMSVDSLTTTSGQSYKVSTIVNYDSRVVPDWKIPHITILES